jgi:catechol 2,3-dioxygenase-like lactoylglutathione lyase family enzyme
MATVQVRRIVHDVFAAIDFYTRHLGFKLEMHPAPPFAMLSRGDLRLVLSAPNPMGGGLSNILLRYGGGRGSVRRSVRKQIGKMHGKK